MDRNALPVAVIGAGPIGLAAAAELIKRGVRPLILEAGVSAGASVHEWGQVRIFSPWKYDIAPAARELLERSGWSAPDGEAYPTGRELIDRYLAPLAALPEIAPHVRFGHRVTSIARLGFDKMKSAGREAAPFSITVRTASGMQQDLLARAVIDASGTYGIPNPLGASGTPALGEGDAAGRIHYGIVDPLGRDRARYAGKRVAVVGSGHSAFDVLIELAVLADREETAITWIVRRPFADAKYGGAENDALPARGALGTRMRSLVQAGVVRQEVLQIAEVRSMDEVVFLRDEERELGPFDEIIATTGFRPDLAPLRELRVKLDDILEAPPALAPLIDPNVHSCGTVPPHGARELAHPEKDFYIAGMKSYGRAPTFLMLTGYEQVRSIASALVGDTYGAEHVELVLPQSGVCSGGSECCDDAATDCGSPTSTCCGTQDSVIPVGSLISVDALTSGARPIGLTRAPRRPEDGW